MGLHDYLNVRRVLRMMAKQWGCPVWAVRRTLRYIINQSWEKAGTDPEAMSRWRAFFPDGKPTPEQYILRLGHAHERGEEVPYLFRK